MWGIVLIVLLAIFLGGGSVYRHFLGGKIRANCAADVECRSGVCISGQCQVRCSTNGDCPNEYECIGVDVEIVRKQSGVVSREHSTDRICVWKPNER